jgi:taurine dioxygenase
MRAPFTARRLTPALGAMIEEIDLSQPLTAVAATALHTALLEHEVLFFRGQPLSPKRQAELARLFGTLETKHHPKFGVIDGQPEVAIVVNDATRPPDIDVWHTDMTYLVQPPAATVLHCIECPANGGDTLWASLSSALRALSPELQRWLQDLRARHALRLDGIPMEIVRTLDEQRISAVHPVIRRHPESGTPCLFVNSVYTRNIEGMAETESRHLLSMLFEISQRPEHQVRFHWEPGSTAIWDNRCTQHYAIADYFPQRRVMHRVQVGGDEPRST